MRVSVEVRREVSDEVEASGDVPSKRSIEEIC
jgi:hypothetical protein